MLHNEARKLLIQALEKHTMQEKSLKTSLSIEARYNSPFRAVSLLRKITGALLTRVTVVPTQPIKTLNLLRSERTVYAVSNS